MYKVTFGSKHPFVTDLKSTTLYGAMCCAISQMSNFGDKVLEDLVFSDKDSLIVTNAFPHNYIPAPLFMSGAGENSYININTYDLMEYTPKRFKMDHCAVNRNNGTPLDHWQEMYNISDKKMDIYIQSTVFDLSDIEKILQVTFLNGIGKHRSTGCGQFELEEITEVEDVLSPEVRAQQTENLGYMILSDYIPSKTDSTTGRYTARIIKGRTVSGLKKEPIYVINAGSCFIGSLPSSVSGIGKVVKDENTNTYASGRALATKISLK